MSEATQERLRRVRAMHAKGISIATIAELEDRVPGYIRMLINGGAKEDSSPEPGADILPSQPRRLSRRMAQYRAWEIVQQRPVPGLGLDANAFWIRLIVEIHETGDGFRLRIGEPASRFPTRGDLAILFARSDQLEIDEWLKGLFARGRLIDIDGVDIGIPHGMKLTPAENIHTKPVAKRPAQPPQGGQVTMLHAVSGGLSDANEIPPQTQIKSQLNLRDDANSIPNGATENVNTIPVIEVARTAAAAANAQTDQSLNGSSSIGGRAGVGELNLRSGAISLAPDASETPPSNNPDANEINLQRSALAVLTDELMALAKINRTPNADELGAVKSWLDAAITADTMRAVIETGMKRRSGNPPTALRYFDSAMRTVNAGAVTAAPTPPPAAPQPVLSAADQVLKDELHGLWQRAHTARKSRLPPVFAAYQAAASNGHEPDARRWLAVYKGCLAADSLGGLPEFGSYLTSPADYEATLLEIEEALTAPDPEAAD